MTSYPMIIVETKHQGPPRAWIAWDKAALARAADAADRDGALCRRLAGGDDPDVDDLLNFIGHDLSSVAAIDEAGWPGYHPAGHGSVAAYAAAVKCAIKLDWLRPMTAISITTETYHEVEFLTARLASDDEVWAAARDAMAAASGHRNVTTWRLA